MNADLLAEFGQLLCIVAQLRSPGGCAWDRAQTLQSMRSPLLEETWEVLDTINRRDLPHLREELGDLLLNVVLLADIANSAGPTEQPVSFDGEHELCHILRCLSEKLVRRHPHVFARQSAADAEEALRNWQEAKAAEKTGETEEAGQGALDQVCEGQAALLYAWELQKKAAKEGFDWPRDSAAADIRHKIGEELAEFFAAVGESEREMELGDILFSVVNLARVCGINPELALARSNRKFRRRFAFVERELQGRSCGQASALEQLWQQAKRAEGDLDESL